MPRYNFYTYQYVISISIHTHMLFPFLYIPICDFHTYQYAISIGIPGIKMQVLLDNGHCIVRYYPISGDQCESVCGATTSNYRNEQRLIEFECSPHRTITDLFIRRNNGIVRVRQCAINASITIPASNGARLFVSYPLPRYCEFASIYNPLHLTSAL